MLSGVDKTIEVSASLSEDSTVRKKIIVALQHYSNALELLLLH
jgi:hypothetical protein